jgi:hypothetical protein
MRTIRTTTRRLIEIRNWELGIGNSDTGASSTGCREAGVPFRIPDDRREDGDELTSFSTERLDVDRRADGAPFEYPESHVTLATFLECNAALGDEILPTLRRPCFLEHGGHRRGAVDQLRRQNAPGPATLIKPLAQPHSVAGQCKCPVPDVLTVLVSGIWIGHEPRARRNDASDPQWKLLEVPAFQSRSLAESATHPQFLIPNSQFQGSSAWWFTQRASRTHPAHSAVPPVCRSGARRWFSAQSARRRSACPSAPHAR